MNRIARAQFDAREFEDVMDVRPKFNPVTGWEMIGGQALSCHLAPDERTSLHRWQREHGLERLEGARGDRAGVLDVEGVEVLVSYQTAVACRTPDGEFHRLWGNWSRTTADHVTAFGWRICKADWLRTPVEELEALLDRWCGTWTHAADWEDGRCRA